MIRRETLVRPGNVTPELWDSLSANEQIFVMAHEIMHALIPIIGYELATIAVSAFVDKLRDK